MTGCPERERTFAIFDTFGAPNQTYGSVVPPRENCATRDCEWQMNSRISCESSPRICW